MATHHLDIDSAPLRGRFNNAFPPVLTIDPGDTVVCRTLDASWNRAAPRFGDHIPPVARDLELDTGHAMCGPVAIRGAEPGDVLEIEIGELRPGRWGNTWAGPTDGSHSRYLTLDETVVIDWNLDVTAGTATDSGGRGLVVRLRPFMGVMGNALAAPGDHTTTPPRRVGGNIDCRELISGSTLWLPIEVSGALFSVGDGHGAQGDGELSGTAIECPMEKVELTFRLRRDFTVELPRAETPAGAITFGFGETLDDAAALAIAGMLDHLQTLTGLSGSEAAALASLVADLRVTQVVNDVVGVHALLPPDVLHLAIDRQ